MAVTPSEGKPARTKGYKIRLTGPPAKKTAPQGGLFFTQSGQSTRTSISPSPAVIFKEQEFPLREMAPTIKLVTASAPGRSVVTAPLPGRASTGRPWGTAEKVTST